MDDTTRMTIATALRNMFEKGWVDICSIDKCLKLAAIIPPSRPHAQLSALHCIHFKDMPRELAERVPEMVGACFNGLCVEDLLRAAAPALENNGTRAIARLLQ